MFELGALAIVTAWNNGVFQSGHNWSLIGMGIGNVEIHLDKAFKLMQMPRMSLAEYERSITNIDVALSLMASPHPSITPFDIAGIGGIVVTNSFENKDEAYFAEITSNIIVKKPLLEDIVQGIKDAVDNVDNLSSRYRGAISMKFPREWGNAWEQRHLDIINRTFNL